MRRREKLAWLRAGYATLALVAPVLAILLLSGSPQGVKAQGTDSSTSTTPTLIAEQVSTTTVVQIPDDSLRAALEAQLGKSEGQPITAGETASLTTFTATGTGIVGIRGIEHATNLTELSLQENSSWDLSPLAGLDKLELLELWHNLISDLEPLRGLPALNELHLGENAISDIEPLLDLPSLQILHVWRNDLDDEDLALLARITGLTELFIDSNSISDVGPLADLTNLESLHLTRNSITDLSPFASADLGKLELLYLWNCEIQDLTPLSGLTSVKVLHLYGNQVEDLSPLSGITNLNRVHLYGNDFEDVSPLLDNDGLGKGDRLDLSGNPLGKESLETHISELRRRGESGWNTFRRPIRRQK